MKGEPEPWKADQDKAISRKMALESVVLLKNDNNLLPLDKNTTQIRLPSSARWPTRFTGTGTAALRHTK